MRARVVAQALVLVALLAVPLAACGGASDTTPTTDQDSPQVAGRGTTPTVRHSVVIPPAASFAEPPAPTPTAPTSTTTSSQVGALLPTGAEAAAWSTAELVAWAGQLDGFTLPLGGTWRSLSVGLQFSVDGSEELDGIETDLKVATPEAVDDLVAQQVAGPPRGSTVLDVVEGEEDGRRTVKIVLHTPGASADSVNITVEPDGGSLVHVQNLPRREGRGAELPEERVRTLLSRLTQGAHPQTWQVRFARLTLVDTNTPAVMVAWSVPDQDVPQAMAAAQAAFGHLVFEPVEINQYRTTADFTYPAAGTSGTVSVNTESDGTTRVELEARG